MSFVLHDVDLIVKKWRGEKKKWRVVRLKMSTIYSLYHRFYNTWLLFKFQLKPWTPVTGTKQWPGPHNLYRRFARANNLRSTLNGPLRGLNQILKGLLGLTQTVLIWLLPLLRFEIRHSSSHTSTQVEHLCILLDVWSVLSCASYFHHCEMKLQAVSMLCLVVVKP